MLELCRGGDITAKFLSIVTHDTLKFVASRTKYYAYIDWVVPALRLDRDGNTTRRPIMKLIFPSRGESLPLNACHRCVVSKTKKRYDTTEDFILAWLGGLICSGAYFNGDNNNSIHSIIQNTMPQKTFIFLQNYFHFSRTQDQKPYPFVQSRKHYEETDGTDSYCLDSW